MSALDHYQHLAAFFHGANLGRGYARFQREAAWLGALDAALRDPLPGEEN